MAFTSCSIFVLILCLHAWWMLFVISSSYFFFNLEHVFVNRNFFLNWFNPYKLLCSTKKYCNLWNLFIEFHYATYAFKSSLKLSVYTESLQIHAKFTFLEAKKNFYNLLYSNKFV
jgi:hypothetical protein